MLAMVVPVVMLGEWGGCWCKQQCYENEGGGVGGVFKCRGSDHEVNRHVTYSANVTF